MIALIVLALLASGCASTLKVVNHARDTYNEASERAVQAHSVGLITDERWDNQVQPALKRFHDTVDQAYIALENGVSIDLSQLKPGVDPQHPTLYDQITSLLEELR